MTPPAPLGAAIGINFQPTGGPKAAITGDFAPRPPAQPILSSGRLCTNGIDVTALHSHTPDEQLGLFFLHFWATMTP